MNTSTEIEAIINKISDNKVITEGITWLNEAYQEAIDSRLVWRSNNCPFDISGELAYTGEDEGLFQPPTNFQELMDCYTGQWEPTHISGNGKHWLTVSNDFLAFLRSLLAEQVGEEDWDILLEADCEIELVDNYYDLFANTWFPPELTEMEQGD